jgi:phenylacetate-CoA ligase
MVKLRGVNVYPQGIGALLSAQFTEATGEYVCIVPNSEGRTQMQVQVEVSGNTDNLAAQMQELLKTRLGVQIEVQPVPIGATANLTQLESRQKPIRLIRREPPA